MKNRRSYKGKNHPNHIDGRTLTDHYCINCGKKISYYSWKDGKGTCKSCATKGKNNPRYIDGKSNEPYPLEFNDKLKVKIHKRDNYKCQLCNEYGKTVHHIDYSKDNLNPDNLITLCNRCNSKVNINRDYYYSYFTYITKGGK